MAPAATAASELATPHSASLWQWMPTRARSPTAATTARGRLGDLGRQRRAVGVAEHDGLRARAGRRAQAVAARSRVVARSRRRSARRRRRRACPRPTRKPTDSAIMRQVLLAIDAHDLLEVQRPRLADDRARRARSSRRGSAGRRRRRPRCRAAASCRTRRSPRARSARCASSSKSSSSFGLDAGKPASIRWMPSSSSLRATRTFSSADSVRPSPCMPSRRVAS